MCDVSDKSAEKIKTQFSFSIISPHPENRAADEKIWKNMVEPDMSQRTI
jgi:hypothetical protein